MKASSKFESKKMKLSKKNEYFWIPFRLFVGHIFAVRVCVYIYHALFIRVS